MLSDDEIEAIAQEHVRKLDRFTRPELPMPNGKPGDNPLNFTLATPALKLC